MTRVAVPLARPAVAALAVFAFLGAWNQYLWPLLVTKDERVPHGADRAASSCAALSIDQVNVTFAGVIIAALPLVILLLVFQKQLVRGPDRRRGQGLSHDRPVRQPSTERIRRRLAGSLAALRRRRRRSSRSVGAGRAGGRGACRSARSRALKKATKPVEITFWHSMPRAERGDAPGAHRPVQLVAVRREGQARQPDRATTTPSTSTRPASRAATSPTSCSSRTTEQQQMIDTQSIVPSRARAPRPTSTASPTSCQRVARATSPSTSTTVRDAVQRRRTRSSTTTRRRSPRPASTPRSRRRRSTRCAAPPRRSRRSGAVRRRGFGLKVEPGYLEHWLGDGRTSCT